MAAFLLFLLVLALTTSNSNHPAVAATGDDDPPPIIIFDLKGPGLDKSFLALQSHDISIAAFTNGSGHYSYSDLIGGLENLPGVPLGREAMLQAVQVLLAYDPATTEDDVVPLKPALASLMVMICEAQRLQPIHETVSRGWQSGAHVAPEHLPYIDHWDTMSYEIIHANRTGKWDGPFTKMLETSANIRSKEEALVVVKLPWPVPPLSLPPTRLSPCCAPPLPVASTRPVAELASPRSSATDAPLPAARPPALHRAAQAPPPDATSPAQLRLRPATAGSVSSRSASLPPSASSPAPLAPGRVARNHLAAGHLCSSVRPRSSLLCLQPASPGRAPLRPIYRQPTAACCCRCCAVAAAMRVLRRAAAQVLVVHREDRRPTNTEDPEPDE
ncbi:hypothetical protein BRADI_4g00485v3 [Brachypodium distachyon]|uniref:rRNA N-glycosylase n=1 Tax=Brachypodium distachyon TaxID=15368 RepID=A0A0Q3EGZ5_BRADI|nr:hypothetical protein BRADI_4g00485v3 [Brachypodium distachyon]